jgi:hypothetical protein
MSKQRYEIIGTWSGPRNPAGDYTRICHREVVTDLELVEFCRRTHGLRFTDGTMLYLRVRALAPGERMGEQKLGYHSLIRECCAADVDSVDGLHAKKEPVTR